jgi:hypothetical protein
LHGQINKIERIHGSKLITSRSCHFGGTPATAMDVNHLLLCRSYIKQLCVGCTLVFP